jgi:ABC-2 type transport system ATP-binding protein
MDSDHYFYKLYRTDPLFRDWERGRMSTIRIEGLHKHYGAVHALDGVNLEVESGSVFGFLGPNGAGKTTAIRILTGLAKPTAGRAWVADVEIGSVDGRLSREIGYLPEEPAFYTWMTPREFLDHVGRLFNLDNFHRKTRTNELLELVGLTDVGKRRIGGFSKGMRQRLGLAQALVNRPKVLFLDEPVSALDPAGRRDILELITKLKGNTTVFMSTHILADIERVCDTVGIINHGQMITVSHQDELMDRYNIPVFEIESIPGSESNLASWTESIKQYTWVESTSISGHISRIQVNDLGTSRMELLKSISQSNLAIDRFEVVRPTLEDVFLRLVSTKE